MIAGPIGHGDVAGLCARLCDVLTRSDATVVVCEVGTLTPSAVAVDALARLQLTARRHGSRIRLRNVSRELDELLVFAGLADVLGRGPCPLRVEAGGQPEQRKQPGGVEERVDRDDPVA